MKKFSEHVDEYLWIQILCCEEQILNLPPKESVEKVSELLIEMNSLLDQFYGEYEEMYESNRYRMFTDPESGKITIIQGDEVDVDVRSWAATGKVDQWNEDDGIEKDDDEDLED